MFNPHFIITTEISSILMKLEGLRVKIDNLPITVHVLTSLRESSRLSSTHYSTMIEGNRLTQEEVAQTVHNKKPLQGRERDQREVLGYYEALDEVSRLAQKKTTISEEIIQRIHALVMGGGAKKVQPTPYRTVQNVIRDGATRAIVYLPPEAHDVPRLMSELVAWIEANRTTMPIPLLAAIAHYQYATIHPYVDGNGRTARLLTTLVLHLGGYGLKGIYSLDEYYAKNLTAYYDALAVGPSHNYYMGRVEADITPWIEYFCKGLLESFESAFAHASLKKGGMNEDQSELLRTLDAKQQLVLSALFVKRNMIKVHDVESLLKVHAVTARALCRQWVKEGFMIVKNSSKKNRTYGLSESYEAMAAKKMV